MLRVDTASVSETADKFARTVAPLYVGNDWLGLGNKSLETAVARVRDIAIELYIGVLEDVANDDYEGDYVFHSTGRVMVIYFGFQPDPQIQFMLDIESEWQDEHGRWEPTDWESLE